MRSTLIAQFKRPTGPLGALAGAVMAARPSNQARNIWTLELLALEPSDRVLEIGFGPGWALEHAAARASSGQLVGVDHSPVMLAQASRRNRASIAAGRMTLRLGGLEALDDPPGSFDAIYSANVAQFWPDLATAFATLRALLASGGRIATTFQPRVGDVSAAAARAKGDAIETAMRAAGFVTIERHELAHAGASAVCVLGRV